MVFGAVGLLPLFVDGLISLLKPKMLFMMPFCPLEPKVAMKLGDGREMAIVGSLQDHCGLRAYHNGVNGIGRDNCAWLPGDPRMTNGESSPILMRIEIRR